ncbi:MAG: CHRD domain-containing protein [Actinomycetota bacterium]|nr:CHRD domain-containing protein [Actinomycetota bacterium]
MNEKLTIAFAVLLLVPLLFAAPALGQEAGEAFNFYADLSGEEEVPQVETEGQGAAALSVTESDPQKLDYVLVTYGLEDIVQAHIHLCAPGENGPVVTFLFSASNGPVARNGTLASGTVSEDELIAVSAADAQCLEEDFGATMDELLQHMRAGDAYVNVHTEANPGGEIRGQTRALPPPGSAGGTFTDDDGNLHEGNIETMAAADITQGCTADGTEYCPADSVTREQMASFIVRAFGVPPDPSGRDFFTDDEGSIHEADINALAAAGITKGCSADGTLYCPTDSVSREQMASFLSRALGLRFSNVDFFTDDDGSIHEPAINALAAAGITQGCSADGTLYCPTDAVPRDQMASFLARALELRPMPPPAG